MSHKLMETYRRLPIAFERGDGCWLWDTSGRRYLDAISGIAVCSLGHAHADLTKAIADQAAKLWHTSNIYQIDLQAQLGERLTHLTGMDRAFICNSGAEANEAAIKLARLYGNNKGYKIPTVIVMENSFHGRTLATLTATGSRKVQAGFEPLVQGFLRVPYGDLEAVRRASENHNEIVAVLVEPIQGEGGVNIPSDDYLPGLREICNQQEWLLLVDEIQTGICRTGHWLACQGQQVRPDVVTLAKALGNGMPVGACLASGSAADLFGPGNHGTTFGGNPLACRVALETLKLHEALDTCSKAAEHGARIAAKLTSALSGLQGVREVRHRGMMLGIELDRPCAALVTQALEAGLLINVTNDRVIRLLPPLILEKDQGDELVEKLSTLIKTFLA